MRLRLEADDADAARREVREMCEELIANPITEDYDVRIRPDGGGGGGEGPGSPAGGSDGGDGP